MYDFQLEQLAKSEPQSSAMNEDNNDQDELPSIVTKQKSVAGVSKKKLKITKPKQHTQTKPDPKYGYPGPEPEPFPPKLMSKNTGTAPTTATNQSSQDSDNTDYGDTISVQPKKAKPKTYMQLRKKPTTYFLG